MEFLLWYSKAVSSWSIRGIRGGNVVVDTGGSALSAGGGAFLKRKRVVVSVCANKTIRLYGMLFALQKAIHHTASCGCNTRRNTDCGCMRSLHRPLHFILNFC